MHTCTFSACKPSKSMVNLGKGQQRVRRNITKIESRTESAQKNPLKK